MKQFDCYGLTDPGRVRGINGDQFLIADLHKTILIHGTSVDFTEHEPILGDTQGRLLMVADGGGGWTAERQASELVVQTITRYIVNMMPWLYRLDAQHEDDFTDDLKLALERSQGRLEAMAEVADTPRELGTTLTMAYTTWPRMYIVHIGNGRGYLLRRGILEQITTDHTLVQHLVDSGEWHPGDLSQSQFSEMISNGIGSEVNHMHPAVHKVGLQPGDTLLLCTDGLPKHVTDDELRMCLEAQEPAQTTCQKLIALANAGGGTDNITAIVGRFGQETQSVEETLDAMEVIELPRELQEPLAVVQEPVV
jgi:protein phosphatase